MDIEHNNHYLIKDNIMFSNTIAISNITIYITPTHFNIQNTHIKQTKFWHQESLDVI